MFFCINLVETCYLSAMQELSFQLQNNDNVVKINFDGYNLINKLTTREMDNILSRLDKFEILDVQTSVFTDDDGNEYLSGAIINIRIGEDTKTDIKALAKIISHLEKEFGQNSSFFSEYIDAFEEINTYISIFWSIVAAIIIFFTCVLLGVVRNNATNNIFDNIKSYSIMRCMGIKNNEIVAVAMTQNLFEIVLGGVGGTIGGIGLKSLTLMLAKLILREFMNDINSLVFGYVWWALLVYVMVLAGLCYIYFYASIDNNLKNQKLLLTLKRE